MKTKTIDFLLFNIGAIFVGLAAAGIMLTFLGENPIRVYSLLFTSVVRDRFTVANIFVRATPLIFTALAFAVTFKAKLFNIGAQGQFFIGCLVAVGFSLYLEGFLVPGVGLVIVFFLTLLGGGIYGGLIGYAKARFNANEFLVSMMSTYVALGVSDYLLRTLLMEARGEYPQTDTIQFYRLPIFVGGTRLHIGFIIAVVIAILVWVMMYKTTLGYRIRTVGQNREAAHLAGINTKRIFVIVFFISGALASLAGFTEVNGASYMLMRGFNSTIGAMGIGIAVLANANPISIIFVAVLFGTLIEGGMILMQVAGIPHSIIPLMQGFVMVSVLISYYVRTRVATLREKHRLQKAVGI
ncbi:MAG: ABC transporter permease [Oscillospiraceae bacterium]|nr:ABC transporter permease [Oscillospiraceae bacterium]